MFKYISYKGVHYDINLPEKLKKFKISYNRKFLINCDWLKTKIELAFKKKLEIAIYYT